MIRTQRRLHRAGFVLLALAVPALVGVGLRARSAMLMGEDRVGASVVGDVDLAAPLAVLDGGRLEIRLPRDWNEPDVLVYAADVALEEGLPPSARLVGALESGRSFDWPAGTGARHVVLYSLAHQRIVFQQAVGGGS